MNIFKNIKTKLLEKLKIIKYIFYITLLKICFSFSDCSSTLSFFYDLCIIILLIINNYYNVNNKQNMEKSIFSGIYLFYLATILSSLTIFILLTISNLIPPLGLLLNGLMFINFINSIVNSFFWFWFLIMPHSYIILKMINLMFTSIPMKIIISLLLICISYMVKLIV